MTSEPRSKWQSNSAGSPGVPDETLREILRGMEALQDAVKRMESKLESLRLNLQSQRGGAAQAGWEFGKPVPGSEFGKPVPASEFGKVARSYGKI